MSGWNMNLITTVERWSEVSEFVQSEGISLRNIHIILEFSLAIPGTSASIEMNANRTLMYKKNIFYYKCSMD
jgi:hypothetical protein